MIKNIFVGIFFLSFSVYGRNSLSIRHLQRPNTPLSDPGAQLVELNLSNRLENSLSSGQKLIYDFSTRYYFKEKYKLFSLSELYFNNTGKSRIDYQVGRVIVNWNLNEKFWGRGVLNNQKNFNLLDKKREGIPAFHFQYRRNFFKAEFFTSFLHIPQFNPGLSNKNGKIKGLNEWSHPPFERVIFNGEQVPISYDIDYPNVSKLILHESIGLFMALDLKIGTFSAYSLYKPEGKPRLVATGSYEQSPISQAVVRAKPFVNHHFITGGGWFKKADSGFFVNLNIERVRPKRGDSSDFEFEALKIQPIYVDETVLSSSLGINKENWGVSVHSLFLLEGDLNNENVFGDRPQYKRSIGVKGHYNITKNTKFDFKWVYDLKMEDILLLLQAEYQLSNYWAVKIGLQSLDAPRNTSFWSNYRSNDAFFFDLRFDL